MRIRTAIIAALAFTTVAMPARAIGDVVQVRSNYFDPAELHVAVGATVTWSFVESTHTVTADDGTFAYPTHGGTANRGESFSWTFDEDATVTYHCAVHGGMVGVIVVGDGAPPPPPPTPVIDERLVPGEFPTIAEALEGAPYGTIVTLAPGRYFEQVAITRPGITIRGTTDPASTVIDSSGSAVAVRITAADVTVQRLTVAGWIQSGVWALNASKAVVEDVAAGVANGLTPVRYTASSGAIRRVVARAGTTAGIAVEACDPCNVVVEGVLAERNFVGLLARDTSAIVIRGSEFRENDAGIVLRTSARDAGSLQLGSHIYGNSIHDNAWTPAPMTWPPPLPDNVMPSGAGIWISGGSFNVVHDNVIERQHFGVVVGGSALPAYGNRITGNTVGGSRAADLAWNGVGAATCFEGNRTATAAEPKTEPPAAQTLYSCGRGSPAGIPYPKVDADIAAYAATRYVDEMR